VLCLRKALYGLRQAPRAWNIKLDASLASLGFTKCATGHALYTRRSKGGLVIVGMYVDDLIITGAEQRDIDAFKEKKLVSWFMAEPREDHLAAVKHLLRYVAGTRDYGLVYPRRSRRELELIGFSYSDMAGDVDGRRSTTGVLFFLGACPISWQSMKQKVVALSTCEAEYIAAATACCQGVWLGRLLAELSGEEARAPVLIVDNQSAIALAKNPVHHDRSKHIDTKYHFIRDCVDGG